MTIETASLPHTADPTETKKAVEELLATFEVFKQTNDERLAEIESRQSADVLLEEKVDRINSKISELNAVSQRPALEQKNDAELDEIEAKAAFDGYLHGADMAPASDLRATASPDPVTSSDGSVFVPQYFEQLLNEEISRASPLARLANQLTVSVSSTLKVVGHPAEMEADWAADEETIRTHSEAPDIHEVSIKMHELYANPSVTQRFFDDADLDVESWLLQSMAAAFAEKENDSFVNGVSSNTPTGILYEQVDYTGADSAKIHGVKSGVSGNLARSQPTDKLLDVCYTLGSHYRAKANWLMNAKTLATIRKLKDSGGSYIWTPSSTVGEVASLLGYPVYDDSNMPDVTTNKKPIAFGDFGRAYMVIRRERTQIIRDPYSKKPLVQFYTTRGVGGRVVDPKALVVLQAAA